MEQHLPTPFPTKIFQPLLLLLLCFTSSTALAQFSLSNPDNSALPVVNGISRFLDIDQDGDLDVVDITGDVLRNDGYPTFVLTQSLAETGLVDLVVGDVDGDGFPDVVGIRNNQAEIFLNDGTGTLQSNNNVVATNGLSRGLALGDVDGDGDLDIFTANFLTPTVSVRLNDGTGSFSGGTDVSTGNEPFSVAVGDLNGDTFLDFVSGNNNPGSISVRFGTGPALDFTTNPIDIAGTGSLRTIALADVDNDGDLDIIAPSFSAASVLVLLNSGGPTPTFTRTDIGVPQAQYLDVVVTDLNGDGDLDIAASSNLGATTILYGDGTGAFPTSTNVAVGGNPKVSIDAGNIDTDTDIDLIAGQTTNATIILINGAAAPLPVTLTAFTATPAAAADIALAWATATERNSSHFRVEHSRDAAAWKTLAEVASAGDTDAAQAYAHTHANAGTGLHYYRLAAVDRDGSTEYSAVVSVTLGGDNAGVPTWAAQMSVYPNPVSTGEVQLAGLTDGGEALTATVTDVVGRVHSVTRLAAGRPNGALALGQLAPGVYVLTVQDASGQVASRRFVVAEGER